MNSAYVKRQRREQRASAALGLVGGLLVAIVAAAVLLRFAQWVAHIPPGWWLPEAARPFGGRWPL